MSLFDFPRIHFKGDLDIDVPTINNAYHFPLTIYDATKSKAFLPPRLYFSAEKIVKEVPSDLDPSIISDPTNNYYFIEIQAINSIELLRTWCMTPIGSDPAAPDIKYLPYYIAAENDLGKVEGITIVGSCPGYWNMFGDMSVKLNNVRVTGVQTYKGNKVDTWTNLSSNVPTDVVPFLNASLDFDTFPSSRVTTASMVETISNQSVYANVFCSNINLYNTSNTDEILLQGKPFRFSALIYSAWRVLNWRPPMSGSARFCSSIPMNEISKMEQAQLIQFFNSNRGYDDRPLKGVFVTFTIFEVFENRFDPLYYKKHGTKSNPAQCTTFGSITPWYEGDMRSGILGRNLISLGMRPIYQNRIFLAPAIASISERANGTAIFSVDLGNSWPEVISPSFFPTFQPSHREDASFETIDIGTLIFRINANKPVEIARIEINPKANSRNKLFETGYLFDFILNDPALIKQVQDNLILGFLSSESGESQVLKESEFMISSDQKGLYANEGDTIQTGYQVYDENRERCILRIFQKGKPVIDPISVGVAEYIVPEGGNDPLAGPDNINWELLSDCSAVQLSRNSLQLAKTAIYYFVYDQQYPNNNIPTFFVTNYTVMDTGSFVCLRVLPYTDYRKYIDPSDPEYTPPTFEVVYEEIFKLYDVVYPVMANILPFVADVWHNGTMAGAVLQRTQPSLWNDISYMPKSRELSNSQLALLKAWAGNLNKSEIEYSCENSPENIASEINQPAEQAPMVTVHVKALNIPKSIPSLQSCAWARQGSKIILIGGRIEGVHSLSSQGNPFGISHANRSIWVIDLSDLSFAELPLDQNDSNLLQFFASNMEFCQSNDTLFIVGGYGIRHVGDIRSNHTFDKIVSIDIAEMIRQVEMLDNKGNPYKAILSSASSPFLQVTGGEMIKVNDEFYLMFGQNYNGIYQMGQTGDYTNSIRKFSFKNEQILNLSSYRDVILQRRDLPIAPIIQQKRTFYAAFGGVFTQTNNAYINPIYIHIDKGTAYAKLDTLCQKTNQYNCAKASIYDSKTDTNTTILFGGMGRYQYDMETEIWKDGDNGAKLPFVKTITQMIFQNGIMRQYIQVPPEEPELPDYIGANAIFIPHINLLYKDQTIDYSKLNDGITSIGIIYGGIKSSRPSSSSLYPTSINDTIYEVFLHKRDVKKQETIAEIVRQRH